MIIPTENRATMKAYREGRELEDFLTDMWKRRATENPKQVYDAKPTRNWPMQFGPVPALPPLTNPENITRIPQVSRG